VFVACIFGKIYRNLSEFLEIYSEFSAQAHLRFFTDKANTGIPKVREQRLPHLAGGVR
jgi:hypothetical protein